MTEGTSNEAPNDAASLAAAEAAANTNDGAQPGADAGNSPVEGEGKGEPQAPQTALEAAERVMAQSNKGKDGAAASDKPQDGTQAKPDGEKDAPVDADEKLPQQLTNHPRFKELKGENRILKVAKEKNEVAIAELAPKAQHLDNLSGWLTQQQLGQEDFKTGLSIMAAMKNDPAKAYELLKPAFERLELMVGVRLPQDLQNEVDAGHLTPERARELVRTRTDQEYLRQSVERRAQDDAERVEREQVERVERETRAVVEGVGAHLEAWAARDPDAAKLRPMVLDQVELEFHRLDRIRTSAWTQAEANKVVDDVISNVRKQMRSLVPTPQARNGPLPAGAPSSTAGVQVPKSSLEAAQAALAGPR